MKKVKYLNNNIYGYKRRQKTLNQSKIFIYISGSMIFLFVGAIFFHDKKLSVLPDKFKKRRAYVTITITGLSNSAVEKLSESLEPMKKEEVFSVEGK